MFTVPLSDPVKSKILNDINKLDDAQLAILDSFIQYLLGTQP